MEATERPWKFTVKDLSSLLVSVPIHTPKGQMILSCSGLPAKGEMQANAKLIVKAVNNFDELVECLKGLLANSEVDYEHQRVFVREMPSAEAIYKSMQLLAKIESED